MEAISQLEQNYFLLRVGVGDFHACIDWAIERLLRNQEGEDLEIVLLAAATKQEEVAPLVARIIERYCGANTLDEQLAAGKYVAFLRQEYLNARETIASLDSKFAPLYNQLDYPNWLGMLARNCEYATDIPAFKEPFEKEFEYVARLWESAKSRAEFESQYSRAISNQHDAKLGAA